MNPLGHDAVDACPSLGNMHDLQRQLDRQVLQFKTLRDLSLELAKLIQPQEILRTFLLMALGPLGYSKGFFLLVDTVTQAGEADWRGMPDSELRIVLDNIPKLLDHTLTVRQHTPPCILQLDPGQACKTGIIPKSLSVLLQWSVNSRFAGLLGVGGPLAQNEPENDVNFLVSLTNIMVSALGRAFRDENIRLLNSELLKKNLRLEETLETAEQAQHELDRRAFHLGTLYDCSKELNGLFDASKIISAFLLTTMGAFSMGQGRILLYDRGKERVTSASRGLEHDAKPEVSSDVMEALLYQSLLSAKSKSFAPMSVQTIANVERLDQDRIGFQPDTALLYIMDENTMGLICLGPSMQQKQLTDEDFGLLHSLANNLLASLKAAKGVETISELNAHLLETNARLEKTIRDLTEARTRIEILENAKEHIKTFIMKETDRARQVNRFDLAFIIGLSVIIGLLFNLTSPGRIPIIPESLLLERQQPIAINDAKRYFEGEDAVFVDARPPEFHEQKHIPGSINLSPALFDFVYGMKFSQVDLEKTIVVYGRSFSRLYDVIIANGLAMQGHADVRILSGGLKAWEKSGQPVAP